MAKTPLPTFSTFGEMLRYLRRRAHLTQMELSIATGYSESQISRLEQNERLPDAATLLARFVPALGLEGDQPLIDTLLALANAARTPAGRAPRQGADEDGTRTHLPQQPTPFIGREQELAALAELLADPQCRLITLLGRVGSGRRGSRSRQQAR